MKKLRLRAIFKTLGYKKSVVLRNDVVYENKSGDMVYLRLERDTYNHYLKYHGKKFASKMLFEYLYKLEQ